VLLQGCLHFALNNIHIHVGTAKGGICQLQSLPQQRYLTVSLGQMIRWYPSAGAASGHRGNGGAGA